MVTQISAFMTDIADEFKVLIVGSIKQVRNAYYVVHDKTDCMHAYGQSD